MALLVTDERMAQALRIVGRFCPIIGKAETLIVIEELGWSDLVGESEGGGLIFEELGNLQIVGLAAAIAAYAEALHPEED